MVSFTRSLCLLACASLVWPTRGDRVQAASEEAQEETQETEEAEDFLGGYRLKAASKETREAQEFPPGFYDFYDFPGNSEPDPARVKYMGEKLAIERGVVRQFEGGGAGVPNWPGPLPEVPKVAFLFLTMKSIEWLSTWEAFFEPAPSDRYSIYVHRAGVKDDDPEKPPLPLAARGARAVPWVQTAWCALFGVEVAILNAALQDPNNIQFVFVSDTTVPLKTFDYVYRQLAELSPRTSKFCLATAATHKTAKAEMLTQEMKRSCVFRDYYQQQNPRTLKHHQWVVLGREHAAAVASRAAEALDIYEASWLTAAPDVKGFGEGCSDEGVPIAALLRDLEASGRGTGNTWGDLTRLGVEQQCLTYVSWRNCFRGSSLDQSSIKHDLTKLWAHKGELLKILPGFDGGIDFDFLQSPLKRELNGFPYAFEEVDLAYLKSMLNEGFMFARKFSPGAQVKTPEGLRPLEQVLPALWSKVDEKKAQTLVWRHLETSGRPDALAKP